MPLSRRREKKEKSLFAHTVLHMQALSGMPALVQRLIDHGAGAEGTRGDANIMKLKSQVKEFPLNLLNITFW